MSFVICSKLFLFDGLVKLDILLAGLESVLGDGFPYWLEVSDTWSLHLDFQTRAEQVASTPPKFNMEPENNGFQMDFPFPGTYFQVPC